MDVLFGVIHTTTLLENLLSVTVTVTHLNVFINAAIQKLETEIYVEHNGPYQCGPA